jgi:hypothetical protein
MSAVGWGEVDPWSHYLTSHTTLYAITSDDTVAVSNDGGPFTNLGEYAKQVSAGLDANGGPEVYIIGSDNAVWVNDGSGWVSLGGYVKQISAAINNTVYAIAANDSVWVNNGSGWVTLGGYVKQISAGVNNSIGNPQPEVYAIGGDNSVYLNNGSGWTNLGLYAKQISATTVGVFAIGGDNAVYGNYSGKPNDWVDLGGYAKQISASFYYSYDISGIPTGGDYMQVFAIGLDDSLYVNPGWDGSQWNHLGGYVTEVSAPDIIVQTATPSGAYVNGLGHTGYWYDGSIFNSINGEKIE